MTAVHEFIYDLAEKISLPVVYLKFRVLMESPNTKIGDFEQLVQADSMLAIRIIRIANSEFFGFNRKVDDLYEAISLIGVIQLHDLLLGSLCMRAFYSIPEQVLNFNDFWRHGIKCGIAARSIAKFCYVPAGNRFFTLGLLLEIGHAAMFVKVPEMAVKALLESRQQQRPIDEVEREYFGFDYCQLGAALMRQWRLPEAYPQIIGHHLYPDKTEPKYHFQTDIVNLAQRMFETPGCLNRQVTQMLDYHQHFAAIPENIEDLIVKEIADHVDEVFEMLSPPKVTAAT
jgi:HD-like signal output (HDOD) protein